MEKITQSFLATVNAHGQKLNELSVGAARQVLTDAQSGSVLKPDVDIQDYLTQLRQLWASEKYFP